MRKKGLCPLVESPAADTDEWMRTVLHESAKG